MFQSQIIDWIRVQREHEIRVGIVRTVDGRERFELQVAPELSAPHVPFATLDLRGLPLTLVRSRLALRRFQRAHPSRNVCVRGLWGSLVHWMAYPMGGPRLIYDFRGDILPEAAYLRKRRLRHWVLARLVSRGIRRADAMTCVSTGAAKLLARRYGRPSVAVIPSCIDTRRFGIANNTREKVRASMGFENEQVVLVYAGGLSGYQMIPQMLRLWAVLQDDPGMRFMLLTNDTPTPSSSSVDVSAFNPGNLRRMTVPREQVPKYLGAADIGFLLRENHPLNHVASPVKFGEYLASGLAVVTSPGLGDVSEIVASRGVGIVVSAADERGAVEKCRELIRGLKAKRETFRSRASETALARLEWATHVPAWREVLGIDAVRPAGSR